MEENSLIRPELENRQEERLENSLRPQSLDEYIGQTYVHLIFQLPFHVK